MEYLSTEQHEVVMEILTEKLLDLKAENDFGNEFDDQIAELESIMDKLDNLLIEYGDGEYEEEE
jgi:hypothetical protein